MVHLMRGGELKLLLAFSLASRAFLVGEGESFLAMVSLKSFTFSLSTPTVVKQVSCLLHRGDFSPLTLKLETILKVELFLEDLLFGGDGGGG